MIKRFASIDPASGEAVWEGSETSACEIGRAVSEARKAFPAWAALALDERVAHVRAFRAVLQDRADDIAETISRETGKALWESRAEVVSMAGKVDISIAAMTERTGERRSVMPFGEAVLRHRPHGVMAVLGPYNFPGHLPNGHIVPALLAGNTVVFKPSELTPAAGAAIAAIWTEAKLPEGVFNLIQGGREAGTALAGADIDGLLFTGSAASGAHLRRTFADRPRVILALELGGNNPLVVWGGEVTEAAAIAVQSAYVTTGQRCSCARRLIVPDTAFGGELIEAVAALADRLMIGAWDETPSPFMGPLVSAQAAERARAQVGRLGELGARIIRPLAGVDGRGGAFVTPALIDVTGVDAPDEEIFAPVLQVKRVDGFAAAIREANATRFGLSAGLVGGDDAHWRDFAAQVRAGVINRNRPTTGAAAAMPFGGLGESGNHRPGGYYAADYCAHPVASFEAETLAGNADAISAMVRP